MDTQGKKRLFVVKECTSFSSALGVPFSHDAIAACSEPCAGVRVPQCVINGALVAEDALLFRGFHRLPNLVPSKQLLACNTYSSAWPSSPSWPSFSTAVKTSDNATE